LESAGRRIEVPLPDGDRLVAFHHEGSSGTVVYLFHGLGGSVSADYMHRTARVCRALGHAVIRVNHRGCGEGLGSARGIYHSGRAEDLSETIALGRRMHPGARHIAIGFSLSGNALLLLLSGARGETMPDCAIAVNAPIDLGHAAHQLRLGFNRIYDWRFVLGGRREVHRRVREGVHSKPYRIPLFSTLHDFDRLYTAEQGGFRDREHYYSSCSTRDLLHRIQIPTVLLTSEDDPFVHVANYRSALLSSRIHLHIEKHGGHMGYISQLPTPLGTRRWLDYALHHYLKLLCKSFGLLLGADMKSAQMLKAAGARTGEIKLRHSASGSPILR